MEQLNIKDYLQVNKLAEAPKAKAPINYKFTLVFDNGSDFVIERDTNSKIKRQLCFIANENLLFIRDPKSNKDKIVTSEKQIKDFFVMNDNIKDIKFKNKYFENNSAADFAYDVYKMHKEGINVRRNLVKYGINPKDYLSKRNWGNNSEIEALDEYNFDKVLKVIKIVQEYEKELRKKDSEYGRQINSSFILFLCRLQDIYTIDYVRTFLDIFAQYDSKFTPSMNNYEGYNRYGDYKFREFEDLLNDFNLDFKRFCTYLFRDLYAQGISEIESSILKKYYDCLSMQKEMYGKVKDKYPEHLKECHDKTVLIYNLNQEYFREKKVEALNVHNKTLEFSDENYSIIVAKTSQDLIEEGINLHHCVGSYVSKVQNAECSIFFLRKTDDIETSLITIEVREDKILQVRGLCERLMDDEERSFLKKWCREKGLNLINE